MEKERLKANILPSVELRTLTGAVTLTLDVTAQFHSEMFLWKTIEQRHQTIQLRMKSFKKPLIDMKTAETVYLTLITFTEIIHYSSQNQSNYY